MMKRRDFLVRSAKSAAGLALMPRLAIAGSPAESPALAMDVQSQFQRELEKKPWLLGWATASREEFDSPAITVSGKIPEEIAGTLYRNGPGGHEVGGRRYEHWFDGDGLVSAYHFTNGEIQHRARFVETSKRKSERKAGRPLVPGFGTAWKDLPESDGPGAGNAANTSVLVRGDDLLALWEGGEAYALDPKTLDTRGVHRWSDEGAGLPFSAHPRYDSNGVLWNFGTAPYADMLLIYQISPTGVLSALTPIREESLSFIHDFVVTDRHLIFMMSPLRYDRESQSSHFLGRHRWRESEPTRWLVIDKADISKRRWFETDPSFVFHFGNAWEEGGRIRIDASQYPDASIMYNQMAKVMRGQWSPVKPEAKTITLDLKEGSAKEESQGLNREFPVIDPRRSGQRHNFVLSVAMTDRSKGVHPLSNAVARQDVETGKTQVFEFPETVTPEEHLFVPKRNSTRATKGWAVGTPLDFGRAETQINVFDAEHIDDGPVATARFPYSLPLGFHGKWAADDPLV